MRCSPAHKVRTKLKVLDSAYRLFTSRGYAATSIDEIMRDCGLTRGGFYAYFRSKSHLYREAMGHRPALEHDRAHDSETWLRALLDEHLNIDSRVAFFATDVASPDRQVRAAYTDSFKDLSRQILERVRHDATCDEDATLSLAAMMVGAAAIARSTDDAGLRDRIAQACRKNARTLLDPGSQAQPLTYFWAGRDRVID